MGSKNLGIFKAENEEELAELINDDEVLREMGYDIKRMSEDEIIREQCWARQDYEWTINTEVRNAETQKARADFWEAEADMMEARVYAYRAEADYQEARLKTSNVYINELEAKEKYLEATLRLREAERKVEVAKEKAKPENINRATQKRAREIKDILEGKKE